MTGFIKRNKLISFAVVLITVALGCLSAQTAMIETGWSRQLAFTISWEPARLVNGAPVLFRVKSETPLKTLSGNWLDRQVFFDFDAAKGTWYGLAGVGLDIADGRHKLELDYTLPDNRSSKSSHLITVSRGNYRSISLSVPREYTEPDAETLVRIRQEQELKRNVFRRVSKQRLWKGSFSRPVKNVTTSSFGTRRTFNGVVQSVHHGLDFRAATGTSVLAMNSGEVILAQELFYEGGFVVIDHGQGLLTLYMHLSKIKAREGDLISKGDEIALSGGTGRVTAPHLHLSVRWQGVYLDPETLLDMQLP